MVCSLQRNPENRCQSIVCIPDWIYAVCYGCFEVITFDYISKPITVEKLESVLLKAMQYLHMIKRDFVFQFRKISFVLAAMILCILRRKVVRQ